MTFRHATRPATDQSEVRRAVKEANRLVGIVQGTMSLEGQGLDGRRLHQIKKQIFDRLRRAD